VREALTRTRPSSAGRGSSVIASRRLRLRDFVMIDSYFYPLIYWPMAIGLGFWLFLEIARRM
jgi:hypothetical protein